MRRWLVINGLCWSTISQLMRLRISQIAATIPILGYALLWSEKAKEYLALQTSLGGWFSINSRLTLLYVGSILLTVALLLFWARCPRGIQRNPAIEDYVLELVQTADGSTHGEIQTQVRKTVQGREDHGDDIVFTDKAGELLKARMSPLFVRRNLAAESETQIRGVYRAHYYITDESRFKSLLAVCFFLTIGGFLFFLPSIEVFCLVIFRIVSNVSGAL